MPTGIISTQASILGPVDMEHMRFRAVWALSFRRARYKYPLASITTAANAHTSYLAKACSE